MKEQNNVFQLGNLSNNPPIPTPATADPDWKKWNSIWLTPPGEDRWKIRPLTFDGIAEAMAEQWGSFEESRQLTFA